MDGVDVNRLELKQRQLSETVRRSELLAMQAGSELRQAEERYQQRSCEFKRVRERLLVEPGHAEAPQARLASALALREQLQLAGSRLSSQHRLVQELELERAKLVAALRLEQHKLDKVSSGIQERRLTAEQVREEHAGEMAVEMMLARRAGAGLAQSAETNKCKEVADRESCDDSISEIDALPVNSCQLDQPSPCSDSVGAVSSQSDALSGQSASPQYSQPQDNPREGAADSYSHSSSEQHQESAPHSAISDLRSWDGVVGCGVELRYIASQGRAVILRLEEAGPKAVTVVLRAEQRSDIRALECEKDEVLKQLRERGIEVRRFEIMGGGV